MNFYRKMYKIATFLVVIFAFTACDDDFNEIGGEIIDNPTDVEVREVDVKAYSRKLNSVQTNNLANPLLDNLTNPLLGVYNHTVFGQSTASLLSQVSLLQTNPDFGEETQLDSVVLTIPYFSTENDDEEENNQYELDSIFGDAGFKVSIHESNYFLSDFDPDIDFRERQKYFSDQQETFEEHLGDLIYENENFMPSADAIVTYEENEEGENDTIVSAPAMRIHLPIEYFQQKIIDKEGETELSSNNSFRDYFRGLFIEAEALNEDGSLILFNLEDSNAEIDLYYTYETEDEDGETITDEQSYTLILGNNMVNTFEGEFPANILQEIEDADTETGEERLYLKGGEGSMAVIELFSDEAELAELKEQDWLINEANLSFYVDQSQMAGADEPEKLYLYDLENNQIIADYSFARDFMTDTDPENPANSLNSFSEGLERDENENGVQYTIRLTQHLTGILNEDVENVKLGLVVTQNINETANSAVRGASGEEVTRVPSMSVLSPQGTVLFGNNADDEDKRLKLRVYYTEPNQD